MRHNEAMEVVRSMRFAAQKFRSSLAELGDDLVEIDKTLHPWLHGDLNILNALAVVEDRGHVTPSEFLNLLYIWNIPEMAGVFSLYQASHGGPELPPWDSSLLAGWSA